MAGKNVFGLGIEGLAINAAVSGTTPMVSTPISTALLDHFSVQLLALNTATGAVGGTVAGQWLIEASNNYSRNGDQGQPTNAGNWVTVLDVAGAAVPATVSGGQNVMFLSAPFKARHIRITFTPTSGAGTMQAWFFGKGM